MFRRLLDLGVQPHGQASPKPHRKHSLGHGVFPGGGKGVSTGPGRGWAEGKPLLHVQCPNPVVDLREGCGWMRLVVARGSGEPTASREPAGGLFSRMTLRSPTLWPYFRFYSLLQPQEVTGSPVPLTYFVQQWRESHVTRRPFSMALMPFLGVPYQAPLQRKQILWTTG